MIIETFKNLAKRNTEVDWIVDGLLSSGGYTYLVGAPKAGKSMLCIQLCDAIQNGKTFLGMKCKKRNCLYVQTDTGRLEWQEQIRRLAPNGVAWTMYALTNNFLDNPEEVENVKNVIWGTYPESDSPRSASQVLKHIPFDLVVFDVLNKMTSHDLNAKAGMSHVLSRLEYMTVQGVAEGQESKHYILIHHPSKSTTRGVNAGSGYGGFSGLCGNMLTLGTDPEGSRGLLVLEGSKVLGKKEVLIERNKETGAWRLSGEVMDVNGPESIKDIEEALGIKIS